MTSLNEYVTPEYALAHLAKSDRVPHGTEGEGVVLELLTPTTKSILTIGCGDGCLMTLVELGRLKAQRHRAVQFVGLAATGA